METFSNLTEEGRLLGICSDGINIQTFFQPRNKLCIICKNYYLYDYIFYSTDSGLLTTIINFSKE